MSAVGHAAAPAAGEAARLRAERDRVTAALVDAHDRLAALGALLQVPTDTLDEAQVLDRMLAEALELTGSDGAWLTHGGGERRALRPGVRPTDVPVAGGRLAVDVPGAPDHVLTMVRSAGAPPYTTGDLRMIETVAAAAGKLVRLTRLHRDGVRRATLEREHRLASELAQAALPETVPSVPGLEVFARCDQADRTGGDLLVLVADGDVLRFAVGDVVGKGLPAAMTMTRAVSALRVAFLTHPDDPAGAVAAVAGALGDYLDQADVFVTAVVGTVRAGGPLRLCNAGHSPAAHRPPGAGAPAGALTLLPPTSPPIGLIEGTPPTTVLPFGPDALLLLGSDGLAEQPDRHGVQFGYDRVLAECAGHGRPAADVGTALLASVAAHAGQVPASDDRTVLVVRGIAGEMA